MLLKRCSNGLRIGVSLPWLSWPRPSNAFATCAVWVITGGWRRVAKCLAEDRKGSGHVGGEELGVMLRGLPLTARLQHLPSGLALASFV